MDAVAEIDVGKNLLKARKENPNGRITTIASLPTYLSLFPVESTTERSSFREMALHYANSRTKYTK
jgi:hypothetical protein